MIIEVETEMEQAIKERRSIAEIKAIASKKKNLKK
jgi:hypothetical protein